MIVEKQISASILEVEMIGIRSEVERIYNRDQRLEPDAAVDLAMKYAHLSALNYERRAALVSRENQMQSQVYSNMSDLWFIALWEAQKDADESVSDFPTGSYDCSFLKMVLKSEVVWESKNDPVFSDALNNLVFYLP